MAKRLPLPLVKKPCTDGLWAIGRWRLVRTYWYHYQPRLTYACHVEYYPHPVDRMGSLPDINKSGQKPAASADNAVDPPLPPSQSTTSRSLAAFSAGHAIARNESRERMGAVSIPVHLPPNLTASLAAFCAGCAISEPRLLHHQREGAPEAEHDVEQDAKGKYTLVRRIYKEIRRRMGEVKCGSKHLRMRRRHGRGKRMQLDEHVWRRTRARPSGSASTGFVLGLFYGISQPCRISEFRRNHDSLLLFTHDIDGALISPDEVPPMAPSERWTARAQHQPMDNCTFPKFEKVKAAYSTHKAQQDQLRKTRPYTYHSSGLERAITALLQNLNFGIRSGKLGRGDCDPFVESGIRSWGDQTPAVLLVQAGIGSVARRKCQEARKHIASGGVLKDILLTGRKE
ncbi:hypothetical protein BKA93DRAFT_747887 [Sparassis latifolia]